MDKSHHKKDGFGNPPQPAVVDSQVEIGSNGFQAGLVLGAHIETGFDGSRFPCRHRQLGRSETQGIQIAGAELSQRETVFLILSRHPGADKVVLNHRDPATGFGHRERLILQIGKCHLLVVLLGRRHSGTQIGLHAKTIPGGRLPGIALNLAKQMSLPAARTAIIDGVIHTHQVITAP